MDMKAKSSSDLRCDHEKQDERIMDCAQLSSNIQMPSVANGESPHRILESLENILVAQIQQEMDCIGPDKRFHSQGSTTEAIRSQATDNLKVSFGFHVRLCMNQLKLFLKTTPLSCVPSSHCISVTEDCTLDALLKLFRSHKIQSCPVKNSTVSRCVGVENVLQYCIAEDLFSKIQRATITRMDSAHFDECVQVIRSEHEFMTSLVKDIPSTPVRVFEPTESIADMMDYFVDSSAEQAVIKTNGEYNVLTRTDLCRFIYQHAIQEHPQIDAVFSPPVQPLDRFLSKNKQPLCTVNEFDTALVAFQTMFKTNTICVPIVNDRGQLVADLEVCKLNVLSLYKMCEFLLPSRVFAESQVPDLQPLKNQLAMIASDDSIGAAVHKMLHLNTHHVWICDQGKPTGVVTMEDVIVWLVSQ
ncbi:hypothetical protein EDD86DRAFT_273607 [Gorgonomyces haynaldii]|nr:hypothetical protein EDD86DRAFT_273607 [Gorgonomyces haynaldii]